MGDIENIGIELNSNMEKAGYKFRIVSAGHLKEMESEIKTRLENGEIDASVYKEKFSRFSFLLPEGYPIDSSIIIIAAPRPQSKIEFTYKDKTIELIYPPTYAGYVTVLDKIEGILKDCISKYNYKCSEARLPEKMLSVKSGLAEYGKNNIGYIKGMGSFYQLQSFYLDFPPVHDYWSEPRMMEKCGICKACQIKCPTGAISGDRFLIHAEKCLVFHNERKKEYPFPEWINPKWHNSVVGCMLCQQFCPEDKPFLNLFDGNEMFSEDETRMIMEGISVDSLPEDTKGKLDRLELLDYYDVLPRNLSVFF